MASNPSTFEVEDQTDEDFFDKLVDDDYGPTDSAPQGSDSDDAKAFSNLSIADDASVFQDSGGSPAVLQSGIAHVDAQDTNSLASANTTTLNTVPEPTNAGFDSEPENDKGFLQVDAEDTNSLASANTNLNTLPEPTNSGVGSELKSHLTIGQSNESSGSGFKVVDWNSFHAESAENRGNGFGSYSDFFNELDDASGQFPAKVAENLVSEAVTSFGNQQHTVDDSKGVVNYTQYQRVDECAAPVEQATNGQDLSNSDYWESVYPGWKYDSNTQQWYQVDSFVDPATNSQGVYDSNAVGESSAVSDVKTELSYVQASQSVVGTASETSTSQSVSVASWNQPSEVNNGYPEHMFFDPQYPGWYYDTIAQEWRSLDTYTSAVQSNLHDYGQQNQNGFTESNIHSQNGNSSYDEYRQADNLGLRSLGSQAQDGSWPGLYSDDTQKNMNVRQAEPMQKCAAALSFGGNQRLDNSYSSSFSTSIDQHKSFMSFGSVPSYDRTNQGNNEANGAFGFQNLNPVNQPLNQANVKANEQMQFGNYYYSSQTPANFTQQSFQSDNQYSPNIGRSPDGRPPHALVTFGFGGKLIVMKDNSNFGSSSYGSQDLNGSSISLLNLQEVVMRNNDVSTSGHCDYFRALWQQSFPGPLVGGNVGSKELNKWIDDRIANCVSSDMDSGKGQILKLLLSLLKIACQHYGKLRSPFGSDASLRENDTPESAVAKLFASVKRNPASLNEYGPLSQCLQKLPSEGEIRATASEVQKLLVSGRKKEALQYAQEGQLWGPALVLASQLGDQFYVDTIKQMALRQLVVGSPLRTLCLLIAGQPTELFSVDTATDSNLSGGVSISQQPTQFGTGGMLDDWEENLAVITANRTKDDELVIIHLGDCLWKERSEVSAAHICYLVAEANFESYSESTRLCLIGADHLKFPRTYASPEAIQRTELYEYSKVLGNSQFILLPLQPYKLIYAHMLAEVGKVSDSLKYCQAILKYLKTGRAPEVEMWKNLVSSLEERIKTHQQGGYGTNLAPAKLVGKLLNFFDSTAHRVVGGLPPPAPSTSLGGGQSNELFHHQMAPRVSTSQSTMTMSSLMPSASMEPISEWAADGNRMTMSNRSISEPDFGRTPRQVDSSKEISSASAQGKVSASAVTSRLSRFGFGSQLLQKTVGLVLKPRPGRQAKLGEQNKFYYDEKLKRWVEEGAELPTEEAALPPPPTTAAFQNGMSDYNLKSALKKEVTPFYGSPDTKTSTLDNSSGIPPIPPSSNQFSARGRTGVRSRYVDTFNQGGERTTNSFQSPSIPAAKPAVAANAKFFVPAPVTGEQTMEAIAENVQEDLPTGDEGSTSTMNYALQPPIPSTNMQRFPSLGNIPSHRMATNGHSSLSSHSRRTASWSGSFSDSFSPPKATEIRPVGEALGMPTSSFMPSDPSLRHAHTNGSSFSDDLQEVEL